MDNTTRNEGNQAVVSALVTVTSRSQPIVTIVEDVHWADAITLAHLSVLTRTVADCPALFVMTSRIEGDQLDQSSISTTPSMTKPLGPIWRRPANKHGNTTTKPPSV